MIATSLEVKGCPWRTFSRRLYYGFEENPARLRGGFTCLPGLDEQLGNVVALLKMFAILHILIHEA
jgi:hypothetical protein